MTVSATSNKIIYNGNGATTVWPFTFPGVAAADLEVYYTDTTGLITLLASNLYSASLNAAQGSNPTGAGGSITYPLTGSPIAIGTFLTIIRTLSLTQATSLANQSTLYQTTIESEMDTLLMQIQQLNELLGRQITVAVSDPTPTALPAAAQRAGLYMGFDASGNPIAVAGTTSTNPVSSAMTPVVSAATLALGRSAFGLGSTATENIGAGLQDDGAGNLRARFTPVSDSINQSVISSFHWTERHATGSLTYTCPATSTLFAGFGFFVYALTGPITFAINAADAFSGGVLGASLTIPAGTQAFLSTDGAGTWFTREVQLNGFDSPKNLQINATVASNNLTVAIKDRNGNDPSNSSPVILNFRDSSALSGAPVTLAITSPLSIVALNGASFGTANAVSFRLWLVCFNNGGTPVLGLINCVTQSGAIVSAIAALDETDQNSATLISASATAAATLYAASAITTKPMKILGYINFIGGQATAGTWALPATKVQLFGPGVKKPGETVQVVAGQTASVNTTSSATFVAFGSSFNITLNSRANPVRVSSEGTMSATSGAQAATLQLLRSGTVALGYPQIYSNGTASALNSPTSMKAWDLPDTAGAVPYSHQGKIQGAATLSYPATASGYVLELQEIMG